MKVPEHLDCVRLTAVFFTHVYPASIFLALTNSASPLTVTGLITGL